LYVLLDACLRYTPGKESTMVKRRKLTPEFKARIVLDPLRSSYYYCPGEIDEGELEKAIKRVAGEFPL
jgi:transposase-like protein